MPCSQDELEWYILLLWYQRGVEHLAVFEETRVMDGYKITPPALSWTIFRPVQDFDVYFCFRFFVCLLVFF